MRNSCDMVAKSGFNRSADSAIFLGIHQFRGALPHALLSSRRARSGRPAPPRVRYALVTTICHAHMLWPEFGDKVASAAGSNASGSSAYMAKAQNGIPQAQGHSQNRLKTPGLKASLQTAKLLARACVHNDRLPSRMARPMAPGRARRRPN